jgi:hypothetical protein
MGCDRIAQLLNTDWQAEDVDRTTSVVAHIRSCPLCHHGLVFLSHALLSKDMLSCDQCRACFPDYYEATRPVYPLVDMPEQQIAEVARHLGGCPTCHEEYADLVLLSELEERGELI